MGDGGPGSRILSIDLCTQKSPGSTSDSRVLALLCMGGREETVGSERMLDVFPFRRPQERRNERVSSITFIKHLIPHKA